MLKKYYKHGETVNVPVHLNFGLYMLDRLRTKKEEIALEHMDTKEKLSYKELTLYAVNLATILMKMGVHRGDTVAVGSEKRNELIPTLLAIVFTGATATALELRSGKALLKHKLNIIQPKMFICTQKFWTLNKDVLQEFGCIKHILTIDDSFDSIPSTKDLVADEVDVEMFEPAAVLGQTDVAFIFFSSGTTGLSKGVQWTHLNCIINSLPDDISDESIQTGYIPGEWHLTFDATLTYKFLASGRKIVYAEEETPEAILRSIDQFQANFVMTVPALINRLSNEKKLNEYVLDALKIIYSGSSPLHKKTIDKVKQRFPNLNCLLQVYGMTEMGNLGSESWSPKGPKSGSVGTPTPGVTIKVSDINTRKAVGANEKGEICVKSLMKGYIGMDLSKFTDSEGFFRTGDLGYYDEDGYFYIIGRLKEIIIYNGYNVSPIELETILQMHPGVREAGVVGRPALEAELGELPTAFVVRQSGSSVSERELLDYINEQVAPYMQLRGGIKFIEKMPRNSRGKILKHSLKDMLEEI